MSNGFIMAFRAGENEPVNYYFYPTKKTAEDEADRLRLKGYEIIKIYQAPNNAIIHTREES